MENSSSKFPFDKYSRQGEFLNTRNFNFPEEFVKKRPAIKHNPFQAYFSNSDDGAHHSAFPLGRPPLEGAFGRWIRVLEQQNRPAVHVANHLLKDKYKLKFSNDDIRTKPIPPKHNLELMRDPFELRTSNGDAFGNYQDDQPPRSPILPRNRIDFPIGKFLFRNKYRDFTEEDEKYQKKNLNPPAELIQVYRGNFDKEAQFQKAFKEWVGILTKASPNQVERKTRKRSKHIQRPAIQTFNETPAFRWNSASEDCCCCRRPLIPPRHQISPLRGPFQSSTQYEREYMDKGYQLRQPIPPRDGLSPPHGALRSATNYNDQFMEKDYSRREYLIPPGGISPPHGNISSNTCYGQEYAEKNYSKREPIVLPDGMSPPHGVVNSNTSYMEFFPDKGYSRRDLIVLPGGISPPHGAMQSSTSYAKDFQDCGHCKRGYLIPPGGISPPHGHVDAATSYNHDFFEREYCRRGPELHQNSISPPRGTMQDRTSYREDYKECEHSKTGPAVPSGEISPPAGKMYADTTYKENFVEKECPQYKHSIPPPEVGFPADEHENEPSSLSSNSLEDNCTRDCAVRIESGEGGFPLWTVEDDGELDTDISQQAFTKYILDKRMTTGATRPKKHKKRSKRNKPKVERASSPVTPRLEAASPPRSPKPPPRMKSLFTSSYSKDFVANTMGKLH